MVNVSNHSPAKKRKPTYLVRREEIQTLENEIQTLQKELSALQQGNSNANVTLTESKNQLMKECLRNQQLEVASAHAMLSHHLSSQQENPLHTRIHLPKQRSARRETLIAMRNDKFQQAYSYLMARSHQLDMSKGHFSGEQFEDKKGNVICNRFDVVHFRGVKSLKQVYDALVFFISNMEISVSETLGDITVRDDFDSLDDGICISNHRLVSNHENGTSEVNAASFAQYLEGHNEFQSSTCAILTTDNIDEDDLHPYDPLNFIRRDVAAAILLTEERTGKKLKLERDTATEREDSHTDSGGEVDVVMRRVAFMKFYRPNFDMPEADMADMCERISQWPNIMVQTIREIIGVKSACYS